MTAKHQIPEVKGVQDPKAARILEALKIILEGATGRTPTKKQIAFLREGTTDTGLLNKINEVIAQLQSDLYPPKLAAASSDGGGGSTIIIGGMGSVTSVDQSLTGDLTENVSGGPVTTTGILARTVVNPGSRKLVFFDTTSSSKNYLALGTGLTISGTGTNATLNASGGGGGGLSTIITSQTTTASTAVEILTGIPSGTPRVDFVFDGVSLDNTHQLTLQFGTSSGYGSVMTGQQTYNSGASATQTNVTNSLSSNIILFAATAAATDAVYGRVESYLIDAATNLWSVWWNLGSINGQRDNWGAALFTMTGEFSKAKVTTTAGTAAFDGGKIWSIVYQASTAATGLSVNETLTGDDTETIAGVPITSTGTIARAAVNPGANRLVIYSTASARKIYAALGTGMSFDGTSINSGGVSSVGETLGNDATETIAGSPVTTAGTFARTAVDPGANRLVMWNTTATGTGTGGQKRYASVGGSLALSGTNLTDYQWTCFVLSDETSALTTGTAKKRLRLPACTVLATRGSLNTASTSGNPVFDMLVSGTSIFGTSSKLSFDATEKTTVTAATTATIANPTVADDTEVQIDVVSVGTGSAAAGAKFYAKLRWT